MAEYSTYSITIYDYNTKNKIAVLQSQRAIKENEVLQLDVENEKYTLKNASYEIKWASELRFGTQIALANYKLGSGEKIIQEKTINGIIESLNNVLTYLHDLDDVSNFKSVKKILAKYIKLTNEKKE